MIRRGATLIIITGLAMLMLSMSMAYLARMKSDGQSAADVLNDAQARLMLIAGMSYVCEASRIGWGTETFGWNDVRDHAPGPKNISGTLPNGGTLWTAGDAKWPAPGSVVRCPMYVMSRPPYAVKQVAAPNPILIVRPGETRPDGGYNEGPGTSLTGSSGAVTSTRMLADFSRLDTIPSIAGLGDVLPLPAARYAEFAAGDATPLPRTREYGWFRVYRETAQDHDGSGSPYFDVVNLNAGGIHPNLSVFIITCGSGATFGFKDYAEAESVNPGLFVDSDHFALLRASERVLHFRVEWSPFIPYVNSTESTALLNTASGPLNDIKHSWYNYNPLCGPFGSIRWTQRLDREPPTW